MDIPTCDQCGKDLEEYCKGGEDCHCFDLLTFCTEECAKKYLEANPFTEEESYGVIRNETKH